MNTATITLPVWVTSVINFVIMMKFWITNPILTFKVVYGKSVWTPMLNIKGVEFMEQDEVTIFRHKNQPGEYRVVINEYTDMQMIHSHLIRIWN